MSNIENIDTTAFFKLGYGLYVVTAREGEKDNGLIINTVMQVADQPTRIAVSINKANYSYGMIQRTGVMNVNCITTKADFELFKHFGFSSGRDTDKFKGAAFGRTPNGLAKLEGECYNAVISLKVEEQVDLGSHGMFICSVTHAEVLGNGDSVTYAYYHASVKPKPDKTANGAVKTEENNKYVCKICGYVYEGEELPEDFVCPWCKHGADAFEKVE